MPDTENNITEEIVPHEVAKLARIFGFLDEQKYKHFRIRESFKKKIRAGIKTETAELQVGEEFKLDASTIHGIVYRKKKYSKNL